ncbi:MAG TPA: DUF5666 domain-containing protein [Solirubrobacterales bacterium]|nr:DUF5666 domain-containing protein [Solirubrobacterales bacterium]
MIRGRAALFATALLAGALAVGLVAAPAQAALRHIDGTVVSKNSDTRTFKLSTQSGTVRIKVNGTTKFDRIAGFGALHKGMRIEVDAQKTSNGLVAKQVEPQGGGGGGGGGDDHGGGGGGADDGPNHT